MLNSDTLPGAPSCLVIEDTSKVGRGGGQIISELTAYALAKKGCAVTLADLGGRCDVWKIDDEPDITLLAWDGWRSWMRLHKAPSSIIYCGTKKAFLLGLSLKCARPRRKIHYHVHSLSRYQWLDTLLAMLAHFFCASILFPTEFTRRRFTPFVKAHQRVVGNAANRPELPAKPWDSTPMRFGFIGRLSDEKGFPQFCELALNLTTRGIVNFIVITQEEPSAELKAKHPHLQWYTRVPREQVHLHYDVLLMLSTVPETYSLSAAEAALAGKLIIARNTGAVSEVLSSYSGIILADSRLEVDALVQKVAHVFTKERLVPHYPPMQHGGLVLEEQAFMQFMSRVLIGI